MGPMTDQVEEEQSKLLTLRPIISKPPGTPPNAEVRLNAAAILREDAVYCKRQQLEAEAIRRCSLPPSNSVNVPAWTDYQVKRTHVQRIVSLLE